MSAIDILLELYGNESEAYIKAINRSISILDFNTPDSGTVIHTGIEFWVNSGDKNAEEFELLLNIDNGILIRQSVIKDEAFKKPILCLGIVHTRGEIRYDSYQLRLVNAYECSQNVFEFKDLDSENEVIDYICSGDTFKIYDKAKSSSIELPCARILRPLSFDGNEFSRDSRRGRRQALAIRNLRKSQGYMHIDEEEEKLLNEYYLTDIEGESGSKYSGTYAREVEGLSDDFIDDVLDGDPDAYWNID